VVSSKRQTLEAAALVVLFGGIMIFTFAGFALRDWMPPAASKHAAGMDGMIRYLLLTTGAVFVIGHGVLIRFIWKFGRGREAGSPVTSARTERLWSIAPVVAMALISEVGVLVIGPPVWDEIYGEVPEDALIVDVAARQFEWIVRYPGPDGAFGRTEPAEINGQTNPIGLDPSDGLGVDDIVGRGVIRLPVNRPAYLRLRSHDVLHSFSVAAVRVKQDIIPGLVGSTQFVPVEVGTYEIGCAELCGLAHYRMRGTVVVMTQPEFDAWLREQSGEAL
jgi:cytochrome c oxidase subunit 2